MHRSDTTKDVERIYDEKIRHFSPEERFSRGLSLTSFCRRICLEELQKASPDLPYREIKVRFFERVYGNEFTEEAKKEIFSVLTNTLLSCR